MNPAFRAYAAYSTVGLELAASVLLGLFGGRWLDARYGTTYLGLVGFFLGIVVGSRAIFRALKMMRAEAEREEGDDRENRP